MLALFLKSINHMVLHSHALGESRVVGFSVSLRIKLELLGWMASLRVPMAFEYERIWRFHGTTR